MKKKYLPFISLSGVFIICATILISVRTLSGSWRRTHEIKNSIAVTGLATRDFKSDLIVWGGSFSCTHENLKEAYALLKKDEQTIRTYLVGKGVKGEEIVFDAVSIDRNYVTVTEKTGKKKHGYGEEDEETTRQVFTGYTLTQRVNIESTDVDKVEKLSREVAELITKGIELNASSPLYYYTKLSELKLQMLAEATKDGHNRAEKIAENSGSKVGKVLDATMGTFQITAQHSKEDYSWGGTFNTTARDKTVSVTVKLQFDVE